MTDMMLLLCSRETIKRWWTVFKIAICDDEMSICSQIEEIVLNYSRVKSEPIEVDIYISGEELCRFLLDGTHYDLIFLDIELKRLNGIEVGKKIREEMENETMQIVYISGKESYAMELFEIRPLHFLVKPLEIESLNLVIKKAMKLSEIGNVFFEFNIGKIFYKVLLNKIIYFESDGKKIKMTTIDGDKEFYGKLMDVEIQLKRKIFLYIHKSYIVNYYYVSEYQYEHVKMSNGDILPISQSNRKVIRDELLSRRKERI